MANDMPLAARSLFLGGEIDWADGASTFQVALLSSTLDAASVEALEFADELPDVEATGALAGRAILAGGVADADDLAIAGVPLGVELVAIAIYLDTGTPSTSPVIYYADSNDDGTPMLRVADGGDTPVQWSNLPQRVFQL